MKRTQLITKRFLLVALAFLLALVLTACDSDERSYYAERYTVELDLQPGNVLQVTETVAFRFEGGPFTYAFREIERDQTDAIRLLEARMDGEPLPPGDRAGQVEIDSSSDPIEVTWHFSPTIGSGRSFDLVYQAVGNLRQTADGDMLYWQVVPEEHEYEIDRLEVVLTYPPDINPVLTPVTEGASGQLAQEDGVLRWTFGAIPPDQAVSIRVVFPAGTIDVPPAWQQRAMSQSRQVSVTWPYAVGLGLGAAFLVLLAVMVMRRRDPGPGSEGIPMGVVTQLPDRLPPALAGYLANYSQDNLLHSLGTLMHLGQRGVLSFEAVQQRGLGRGTDFLVRLTNSREELQDFEQVLLDEIMGEGEMRLSEFHERAASRWKAINSAIRQAAISQGLIDPARLARRQQLMAMGTLLLIASIVLIIPAVIAIAGVSSSWAPLGIPWIGQNLSSLGLLIAGLAGGLFIGGFVLIIAGSTWPPFTARGAVSAERWNQFREYLRDPGTVERANRDSLEAYLPWATTLGESGRWARALKQKGLDLDLSWVQGADSYTFIYTTAAVSAASGGSGGAVGAGGGGGGASGAG